MSNSNLQNNTHGGIMKRLVVWSAILLLVQLVISGVTFADIDFYEYQELSCETFIAEAIDKDPEFLRALQTYLSAKYDVLSAKSIAAWTLGAQGGYEHTESFTGPSSYLERTNSYFYEVSLEKLFLVTGTGFKISHQNSVSEMKYQLNLGTLTPGERSYPSVTVSVIQPLLKNAFGLADRFPLKVAKLQVKAAELDVKEAWENRIAELHDAYLLWVAAYENTVALQEIVSDLKQMEKQIRRKVNAKVAERADFLLAREAVLNYQGKLIQAEGDFVSATLNIISLRSGNPVTAKDFIKIKPSICYVGMPISNGLPHNFIKDVSQLRLVKQLGFLKEQIKEDIRVAKNERLPDLDVVGEYTKKAQSNDDSGGYSELEKDNREDYLVMLQLNYPIGSQAGRANLGKAKADLSEVEMSIKSTEQSLSLALQQIKEDIVRLQRVLDLLEERVKNAEEKLRLDTRNYKIGRLDTRYLIDSRNTLTNVRLEKVQAEVELKQLAVEYLSTTDTMLNRFPKVKKRIEKK